MSLIYGAAARSIPPVFKRFDKSLYSVTRIRWAVVLHVSLLIPGGMVAAEGGGQADMSSLTKKPSRFSFRSPQNANRGDCNQFTLAAAWNMARLFSIFFCFVAPTLADYAVLPEDATGPNLLTRILMDACMRVASRLRVPVSSSLVLFHESITDDVINHQSDPRLFATYFSSVIHKHATLSKPSKSLTPNPYRSQATAAGGLHLIWFFPQTATPYLSLWTHLKVIPLLTSETTRRNVKAGACVCPQHDLDGRWDLYPPTHLNTYVPTQGCYCQTGMAWSPEAPQSQRDVRYLTVCLWATSFLLASETLSHDWPCDLTLSKSFTQAAAHCWALKVSGHKHRGSFPLNGGELRQHRHKHLWWFIPGQEIYKCTLTWTMEQFIALSEHPHIFILHLWTQCLVLSATAVSINGLSCTQA